MELLLNFIKIRCVPCTHKLMQKVNMGIFEDPGASTVAAVRVTCHPEAHVVPETGVDKGFVYTKELTNLLDFVPISEEEKRDSGLEIIRFWWSHAMEGRQQHVMESGYWSSVYWGYNKVECC
jgi:hypothetical protein